MLPSQNQSKSNIDSKSLMVDVDMMIETNKFLSMNLNGVTSSITAQQLQGMKGEFGIVRNSLNQSQFNFSSQIQNTRKLVNDFYSRDVSPPSQEITGHGTTRGSLETSKNRNNQRPAQKTSSQTRQERYQKNSAHSERGMRGIDRNVIPADKHNSLDVWLRAQCFFQPLPTVSEFLNMCEIRPIAKLPPPAPSEHWSFEINEIVRNSQRENKKTKVLPAPGPSPAKTDISEYWKDPKHQITFPIEDIQKQNSSIMHHLLSAFVEADPMPRNEIDDDLDSLPTHVLLPQIEFDDYLSHSFEERLQLELQGAGLEKPIDTGLIQTDDIFIQEIQHLISDREKLVPKIEEAKKEVLDSIPSYHHDERRRMEELKEYHNILRDVQRKKHKK